MLEWLLVTLTLDAGRMFNYPTGAWTLGTCPGVEVAAGPITVNAGLSFDRSGVFSREVSVNYERELNSRLTLAGNAARYDYPGYAPDLTAGVSLRWVVKR